MASSRVRPRRKLAQIYRLIVPAEWPAVKLFVELFARITRWFGSEQPAKRAALNLF
jgi:hypothetical protein